MLIVFGKRAREDGVGEGNRELFSRAGEEVFGGLRIDPAHDCDLRLPSFFEVDFGTDSRKAGFSKKPLCRSTVTDLCLVDLLRVADTSPTLSIV